MTRSTSCHESAQPCAQTASDEQVNRSRWTLPRIPGRSASSVGTCATAMAPVGSGSPGRGPASWVMRATSSRRRFSTRSTVNGGRTHAWWPSTLTREVDRGRQDRRAAAQCKRGRPPRHRRRLTEELDLGAAALEVTICQQAHDVVVVQRLASRWSPRRTERDHVHPEAPSEGRRTSRTAPVDRSARRPP